MMTIRELRHAHRLRRADLAVRLDVSVQTVYYWERGRRPTSPHLLALAALFNVPAESIQLGAGVPRKRPQPASVDVDPA